MRRLSGATARVDGDLNGIDKALHAAKLEAQSKDVTKQLTLQNNSNI